MSLYNLMHGVSPIAPFVLPMLFDDHPDSLPRFRDVFLSDEAKPEYDDHIHIYTRVGSSNQNCGFGEELYLEHPRFVAFFDDGFDNTFGTYVFTCPDKWRADLDALINGQFADISEELRQRCVEMFPKLIGPVFSKLWSVGKDGNV